MRNNCMIVLIFQEFFKADFYLCLNRYMFSKLRFIPSFQKDIIFRIIFLYKGIHIPFCHILNIIRNFINRICINFPSEFNLCFYLIAFRYRNIPHIVGNTAYPDMGRFHNADCSPHPVRNLLLYFFIVPMPNYDFPLNPHTAYNMPIFPVAVSRLVFIHKVHINRVIRDFFIKLCM